MTLKLKNTNFINTVMYKSPILINNLDNNKIVVSNKFFFCKQDFKYFISYKDNKKIRCLWILVPEISIYKRYSDKTKCLYIMMKDEHFFHKYMKIWEKVSNIIKNKFNSELIYHKKYLKAEKKFDTKESFQCLYIPVILIDLFYRKDENYYLKVFLEKFIHNFFWRSIRNFGFWGFGSSLLKHKKSFKLGA